MGGVQPVEDRPSGRLRGDDALAVQPVQAELNAGRRAVAQLGVNLATVNAASAPQRTSRIRPSMP